MASDPAASPLPGLGELLARVERAEGPSRELDGRLDGLVGHEGEAWPAAYTASIDAALALVERVLPGWAWKLVSHGYVGGFYQNGAGCGLAPPWSSERPTAQAFGKTPALALVAALLRALIAKEPAP